MAKLNVVIPSMNVEVGGVKYRKVERNAIAGDIVKITDEDVSSYLTDGAFYEVDSVDFANDPQVTDDDGDDYDLCSITYEVYEKVTEAPLAEPSAPIKYREVKREANVGERIKIVARAKGEGDYENGAEFTVNDRDEDGDVYVKLEHYSTKCVFLREYAVLEPIEQAEVAQPERLKVGEYAKVIDTSGSSAAVLGDIVKVTRVEYDANSKHGDFISVETSEGKRYNMFAKRFNRVTYAEVTAAKQALERTKAVGEFAEGGYAVITGKTPYCMGGFENGDYVSVTPKSVGDRGSSALTIRKGDDAINNGFCDADALRKITKEEYEAATKPVPKFEVGEKVRLISGEESRFLRGFNNGDICGIHHLQDSDGDYRIERVTDGRIGYADPSQLEKVSAEEGAELVEEARWNAIGRKVGEYKAGDIVESLGVGTGHSRGTIGVITVADGTNEPEVLAPYDGEMTTLWTHVKLIAPVESLFNATSAGGERK